MYPGIDDAMAGLCGEGFQDSVEEPMNPVPLYNAGMAPIACDRAAFAALHRLGLAARVEERTRTVHLNSDDGACELAPEQLAGALRWLELQLPDIQIRFVRPADPRLRVRGADRSALLGRYLTAAAWLLMEREPALRGDLQTALWTLEEERQVAVHVATSVQMLASRQAEKRLNTLLTTLSGDWPWPCNIVERTERTHLVQAFRDEVLKEAADASRQQAQTAETGDHFAEPAQRLEFGQPFTDEATAVAVIQDEMRRVCVAGRLFGVEVRELSSGRQLCQFHISDGTDSLTCKLFSKPGKRDAALPPLSDGLQLRVRGAVQYDTYAKELVLQVTDLHSYAVVTRRDSEPEKRVELHAHTQMSALDGVVSASDLIRRAKEFGHSAVAITDHGVVQAYPDAYAAGKKHGIKILYGIEANVVDAGLTIVYQQQDLLLDADTLYVVFDTETTGLSAAEHELIEIAGVKMRRGEIVDTFAALMRPRQPISAKITEITHITNEMVADQPDAAAVLPGFREFCEGAVLVAHNAEFDMGFLSVQAARTGVKRFSQPVIDTLALARAVFPGDRNHRLKTLTQKYKVTLTQHHRALADAEATGRVFYKLLEDLSREVTVSSLADLAAVGLRAGDAAKNRSYHTTILVSSQAGLKNLYRLVSYSHIESYYREPRIPRSLLREQRDGLLIGSGCKAGELFQAMLRGKTRDELRAIIEFYDFIELQPPDHYEPLLESGDISNADAVRSYHRQLLELADEAGKPVVATGDVHFLDAADGVFREIIKHSANGRKETERPILQPALTLRTTAEMLADFAHLGERAHEVVVHNPRAIAEQIESISPVPDRVYPPIMEGADEQVRTLSTQRAHQLYGAALPTVVANRMDKELHSIITHGFAVNYLIAHKLVTRSLDDGYIVGSRGSVGSSFVATMLDITEVNPLAPHYLCGSCQYSEFILDGTVGSGFDLPDKLCPNCGAPCKKDGQDIPFETFLGFEGDKVPDIDLNFSGEYQARAHKYTEELFGSDYVYRAGTISTIADKTAFGYVRKWADDLGKHLRNAEIARLVAGCTGIKRTTGQHPGGLIIVPSDHDIYDFCPIQHPADDRSSGTRTTHFDFHAIHDNLLKLDILGHDDPTVLRMLQDITGVDVRQVAVDDPQVYALFRGTAPLGVTPAAIRSQTGTYGIPEFGTKFVRQMLEDTKPGTFADLVRISGLSHGTDVWLNNAQELIHQHVAPLQEVICCRDDIMVYLIYRGLEPARAFKIMESVRRGKGLTQADEEYMASFGVPDWYLESCRRIKYMFPKAHAAAYVLNAVRIAYFKVHHPLSFYAAYFTVRAEDFDLALMERGADAIALRIEEIEGKGVTASPKEKSLQTVLELALEMTRREFTFRTLDLYQSDATRFLVRDGSLLPPFAATTGIGDAAARNIVAARAEAEFLSVEDLQERAHLTKTVVELLDGYGCFANLPVSNQLSLF